MDSLLKSKKFQIFKTQLSQLNNSSVSQTTHTTINNDKSSDRVMRSNIKSKVVPSLKSTNPESDLKQRGRVAMPSIISNQPKPLKVISNEPKVVAMEKLSSRVSRNTKGKADSSTINSSNSNQTKARRKRTASEDSNDGTSFSETSRAGNGHPGPRTKRKRTKEVEERSQAEEESSGEDSSEMSQRVSPIQEESTPKTSRSSSTSDPTICRGTNQSKSVREEVSFRKLPNRRAKNQPDSVMEEEGHLEVPKNRTRNRPELAMEEASFRKLPNSRARNQPELLRGESSFRVLSNNRAGNQPEPMRGESSFRVVSNSRARNQPESMREDTSFRAVPNSRARNQPELLRGESSFRVVSNKRARNQPEPMREEPSFRMLSNNRTRNQPGLVTEEASFSQSRNRARNQPELLSGESSFRVVSNTRGGNQSETMRDEAISRMLSDSRARNYLKPIREEVGFQGDRTHNVLPRMNRHGYYQNEPLRDMDRYYQPEVLRRRDYDDDMESIREPSNIRIPPHQPIRRLPDFDSDTRSVLSGRWEESRRDPLGFDQESLVEGGGRGKAVHARDEGGFLIPQRPVAFPKRQPNQVNKTVIYAKAFEEALKKMMSVIKRPVEIDYYAHKCNMFIQRIMQKKQRSKNNSYFGSSQSLSSYADSDMGSEISYRGFQNHPNRDKYYDEEYSRRARSRLMNSSRASYMDL